MAGDAPGRPPLGPLLAALRVRRNVAVGAVVGACLAATLFAVRFLELLGPAPDRGTPLLFAVLAVVLAVSAAGLVAALLTLVRATRIARDVGDEEDGGVENGDT